MNEKIVDEQKPKPGTLTAMQQGCTCPAEENGYGLGVQKDGEKHGWVVHKDCPLHGVEKGQNMPPPERKP